MKSSTLNEIHPLTRIAISTIEWVQELTTTRTWRGAKIWVASLREQRSFPLEFGNEPSTSSKLGFISFIDAIYPYKIACKMSGVSFINPIFMLYLFFFLVVSRCIFILHGIRIFFQ
jgi:hypothetical protein